MGNVLTRAAARRFAHAADEAVAADAAVAVAVAVAIAAGVAVVINIVIDDDKCCRLLGVDI